MWKKDEVWLEILKMSICHRVRQSELHPIEIIKIECSQLKHKYTECTAWKVDWRAERIWPYCENSSPAAISPITSPWWLYKDSRSEKIATKLSDDLLENSIILEGFFIKKDVFMALISNVVLRHSPWNFSLREQIVTSLLKKKKKFKIFPSLSKLLKKRERMTWGIIFDILW